MTWKFNLLVKEISSDECFCQISCQNSEVRSFFRTEKVNSSDGGCFEMCVNEIRANNETLNDVHWMLALIMLFPEIDINSTVAIVIKSNIVKGFKMVWLLIKWRNGC